MDTLAHGLWGGVGFYPRGLKKFGVAFLLGAMPDLLSFGLFFVTHPSLLWLRLAGKISGPPPLSTLPDSLFYAYNLTHSLVVWALLFGLIWIVRKNPPWVFLAWALHILCDIPTHTLRYFPTPYFWPFPSPLVNGISWATPEFMMANYTALLAAYGCVFAFKRGKAP